MRKILFLAGILISMMASAQMPRNTGYNAMPVPATTVPYSAYQIGTMYDSSTWANLAGFTTNSAGFTAASGHIHVACDASNTQYLRLPFTTMLDNYAVQIDFKVGTYTAANDFGLQIWINSINSTSHANATVVAYVGAHTGADIGRAIFVSFSNGTGTNYLGGGTLASIASGDSITLIMTRTAGSYSLSAQNWTHPSTASYTVPRSFTYSSPTGFTNNTANIQITPAGSNTSTYDIYHIKYSSTSPFRPAIGLFGNSLSEGSYAGSATARFGYLINAGIFGGSGDETSSLVARIPEMTRIIQPKYAFFEIGTNDIAFGVSSATWQANMTTIHDSAVKAGIIPVFLTPFPRNDVSTLPARTFILAQGWNYIDTYTLLVGTGTNINAAYDAGDHVHLNAAGHLLVANYIITNSWWKAAAGTQVQYQSHPGILATDLTAFADVQYVNSVAGGITGLTAGVVPKAISTTAIGNGIIQDNGTQVGIGAAPTSGYSFDIQSASTGTLAGIHGATNGFYYANWALANTAGNKIWNWVLLDNANMAFQTYNGTRVLTPQMWFTNGHSILDSATATTASDNGEWLSLGGAKVGVINDFRVHGYNLNFGNGAGNPIQTFNFGNSSNGSQIQSQQVGVAAMGIDMNTAATFSGTANNINGRQIALSDLNTSTYRLVIDAAGTTWWGAAANAYNFKILYKNSGLFTGSSIDADGIFNARAGTTTLAQINLPAGTKKTTMAAGDLTYATGHLWFHDGSTDYDLLATGGTYTLPTATTSTLGGVKIDGATVGIASGVISTQSSTYTPTFTTTTNLSTATPSTCTWYYVGTSIHAVIRGAVSPTSTNSQTVLTFTLPVSTSNTTQLGIGNGTFAVNAGAAGYVVGQVDIASGTTAVFRFTSGGTAGSGDISADITYQP